MDELNRLSVDEFRAAEKRKIVVVLDNIRSQHNIGSVFRTADAFAVQAVYLCGITATPPNREMQKTALGSTESVNWKYFSETALAVSQLKEEGFRVICVEQVHGSVLLNRLHAEETGGKIALIFGNEVNGVDEDVISQSDLSVEIPQTGTKHSLNISVTTGIVLWHFANLRDF